MERPIPLSQLLRMSGGSLPMFTVYAHPLDHPGHYVARLSLTLPHVQPTNVVLKSIHLEAIRAELRSLGLTQIHRAEADDPAILETWL